jgi:hypothetical protein
MYCPNIPVHPLNERGRPTITLHRKSSSGLQVQIFRSWEADQNPPRKQIVIFAVTANSSGEHFTTILPSKNAFYDNPSFKRVPYCV